MMYSTGTLAREGGGKGRGTNECIARRGAVLRESGPEEGRLEEWELASGAGLCPESLIACASDPRTQLPWRAWNMCAAIVLFSTGETQREGVSGTCAIPGNGKDDPRDGQKLIVNDNWDARMRLEIR